VRRTALFLHSSAGRYGADLQLVALASGLDRERWDAVAVLPERGTLAPLLERAGVKVVERRLALPGGSTAIAARMARDRIALSRVAMKHEAAIVHANTSVVLAGAAAAKRARVPYVVHMREIYDESLWPRLRGRILRADAVLCVSEAVAAQFGRAPNVSVVRDCLARPPSTPVGAVVRKAMRIPPDAFVVALVGRVSDWKGQDVLSRALAEPELAEIGAVGLVAGDSVKGEAERKLAELKEELDLGDRLRLLGFRDDVGPVYGAADAAVVPSTRPEPLGQAALEAAWAGLPVVGTAHGGLPEIVRDGETGILVPPGDHRALALALRGLADDPVTAKQMGERAARDVRESHTCGPMLAEVQSVYDRLAPEPRRRRL
jgi:glycosyltransferase involved in cell wall biosynthesis